MSSAWGLQPWLVPTLERHATGLRWFLLKTLPCMLGLVLVLAGFTFGRDWLKERRERGRPLPPADSPNVLLIVLDTVRADHLSLYGYARATTPTLERLAKQGIRFDEARATAPWTLASHASMFTGRWPHELAVKWLTPLAESLSHAGRIPRLSRLCNRGFCRQYPLLFVRHRPRPRLYSLRRLRPRTSRSVSHGTAR